MEIKGEGFVITRDPASAEIACSGILDLRGKDGYGEISRLFEQVAEERLPVVTLDLRKLEFLNSSGITTLGGFIIKLRDRKESRLRVLCSSHYTWQSRSMQGLQRLMPGMSLEFE